jgi:hypothetical protein
MYVLDGEDFGVADHQTIGLRVQFLLRQARAGHPHSGLRQIDAGGVGAVQDPVHEIGAAPVLTGRPAGNAGQWPTASAAFPAIAATWFL